MRRFAAPLSTGILLLLPASASAQAGIITAGIPGCDFVTGQLSAACIPSFIAHVIQFLFGLLGTFFLINVMIAGYQMSVGAISTGDRSAGKNRLIWSAIGLFIAVCAFLIVDFAISTLFG